MELLPLLKINSFVFVGLNHYKEKDMTLKWKITTIVALTTGIISIGLSLGLFFMVNVYIVMCPPVRCMSSVLTKCHILFRIFEETQKTVSPKFMK